MEHLCLDIGNVLCRVDFTDFFAQLRDQGIEKDEAIFFITRLQAVTDVGHTNIEKELRYAFRFQQTTHPKIHQAWLDCIQPDPIAMDWLGKLIKIPGLKIALLSNMGNEHMTVVSQRIGPVWQNLIPYLSCDVGVRKPTRLYYRSFLQEYPEFEWSIYVDDNYDNLNSAKRYNFQTKHFDIDKVTPEESHEFWRELHSQLQRQTFSWKDNW